MHNKKAFSFVEIIITVSIIALLAVIGISSKQGYDENMNNTKVVADITTINNALTSFSEETKTLPMPGGNTNFYSSDTTYKHSYDNPDTFGVYGSLTEETLAKKYLNILPLDPRTNSYYAYGKTKATNEFEIASIQYIDTKSVSKVVGNYAATNGPYNLIREYNGPNFVYTDSNTNFPYNPEELILLVTTKTGAIYREGDTITTGADPLEIFFSDGSVSILEANSQITLNKLNFKGTDNLNTFVRISLLAGTIWTRATKLNEKSTFEVYTTDTIAAVRGTIFKVSINALGQTEVTVIEGAVDLYKIEGTVNEEINKGTKIIDDGTNDGIEVLKSENPKIATIYHGDLILFDENLIIEPTTIPGFTNAIGVIDNEIAETAPDLNHNPLNPEDTTCNKFMIVGIAECVEADKTLTASGYTLEAYAPYNNAGDLNMYRKNDDSLMMELNGITGSNDDNNSESFPIGCDKTNSFCNINGVKGVFIGNLNSTPGIPDFIKYTIPTDLNLGSNFAIEMSVDKNALIQTGGRFIFDNNLNKGLSISNISGKYQIKYGLTTICNDLSTPKCNISFNNNFEKIIVKNGNELIIGGQNFPIGDISINNLFVGSRYDSSLQLNGVVDYLKIYSQ